MGNSGTSKSIYPWYIFYFFFHNKETTKAYMDMGIHTLYDKFLFIFKYIKPNRHKCGIGKIYM